MFSLRWSQIVDGQIRLTGINRDGQTESKGKKGRTVPIIPDVQKILDEVRGHHQDLVFVSKVKKKKINIGNFDRDYWKPALEAARITNFRWHDLRHTFCSWIIQQGGSLKKLQMLVGHKHFSTTKKYAHLSPEHLVTTIDLLSNRIQFPDVTPIGSAR